MIELALKQASTVPLDLTGILPTALFKLTDAEIENIPLSHGHRRILLGEFFDISRSDYADELVLRFAGGCSFARHLGAGLDGGQIIVAGHAGDHAFEKMTGGQVSIEGDAGDWLAAGLAGGSIRVGGSAGHHLAASLPGARRGMTGGNIVIEGNAGDEVGRRMRRGRIGIRGHCGSFAGYEMIAGTIHVRGCFGDRPGAGMKRGTLVTHAEIPMLSPGFRYSCDYEPAYLRMIDPDSRCVKCYRGDQVAGGRGELWQVV